MTVITERDLCNLQPKMDRLRFEDDTTGFLDGVATDLLWGVFCAFWVIACIALLVLR